MFFYIIKKRFVKIILLLIMLVYSVNVFADDIDESINYEIEQEIIDASINITNEPSINSRAAVVIDRISKEILYEKNIYEKRPMASTTKMIDT